jgi:hypothetical protein
MQITKDEYLAWLALPVTQEVHSVLRERREKIAEQLVRGACLDDNIAHARAVGRADEIKDLLEMTYDDMLPKEGA